MGPKFKPTASVLLLVIASAVRVALPQAAIAPPGFGAVDGYVTSDDGSPVRLAIVSLYPLASYLPKERQSGRVPLRPYPTYTDLNGFYLFTKVQPGIYIVRVQKDGYSDDERLILGNSDQFSPARLRKILADFPQVTVTSGGTSRDDVVIRRGAAISGRISFDTGGVLDHAGQVFATLISSPLFDQNDANDDQKENGIAFSRFTTPDDRGIYRFSGLPQGTYRIDVRLQESQPQIAPMTMGTRVGYADLTVFAPSSLSEAGAGLVKVEEGEELSDVDITIPIGRLHSVSGIVEQNGAPLASATVTIHPQKEKWNPHIWRGGATTISDGSFRFDLVPSGTYILEAKESRHDSSRITRRGAITVVVGDSDVTDANIDLNSAASSK